MAAAVSVSPTISQQEPRPVTRRMSCRELRRTDSHWSTRDENLPPPQIRTELRSPDYPSPRREASLRTRSIYFQKMFVQKPLAPSLNYQLPLAPPPPELPPPNPPKPPPPPNPPPPPPNPPPPLYPPPLPMPERSIQKSMLRSGVARTMSTMTISRIIPPAEIPPLGRGTRSAGGDAS